MYTDAHSFLFTRSLACAATLFGLALTSSQAVAQCPVSFGIATSYQADPSPFAITTGDVNGDGRPDVVVASLSSPSVSVYLNAGNGTLQPRISVPVLPSGICTSVVVANLGGHPGSIVSSTFSGVRVLINNGGTNFLPATVLAPGTNIRQVAVGDVNGDGNADIVAANQTNAVIVFIATGGGNFTAGTSYPLPAQANGVAITDFDGDGLPDLLASLSGTSGLMKLRNIGNGNFQAAQTAIAGVGGVMITLADANGDGRPDVFIPNPTAATLYLVQNFGGGNFGSVSTLAIANSSNTWNCAVTDVTTDGLRDVLIASNSSLVAYRATGPATYSTTVTMFPTNGAGSAQTATADLNGDGLSDSVVTNFNSSSISVFLNTSTAVTASPMPTQVASGANASFSVTAANATGYQWRLNGVPLTSAGHYAGVNTPALTVLSAGTLEAGNYDCVVTGTCSQTSAAAALTLAPPPCAADVGVQGGGFGHDGLLDNNDFISFINLYFTGCAN